jgi:predicted O-linked N-acetylglucosamine transferase (SPINDLY family)
LLRLEPEAQWFFKGRQFDVEPARQALVTQFIARGISVDRLRFSGFSPRSSGYFEALAGVDVALDPFPFTGGATSLDTLWMGVPLVTLAGDRMVARQGISILNALGRHEWIAQTPEDYLRIARQLLKERPDPQSVREQLLTSPLCDLQAAGHEISSALHSLWSN